MATDMDLAGIRTIGHSDGANVALTVVLTRPDLTGKLVLISGNFHHEGLVPGILSGWSGAVIEQLAPSYGEVSPDGQAHYPIVVDKLLRMQAEEPVLTATDLARISQRTLVVSGDDDIVTLEHTLKFYRALANGGLAVVPGTSHLLVDEKPESVHRLILDFLTTDPTPTLLPVRRTT